MSLKNSAIIASIPIKLQQHGKTRKLHVCIYCDLFHVVSTMKQSPEKKSDLHPAANSLHITFLIIRHGYDVFHAVSPFSSCKITSFACIRVFRKPNFM